jgi:hydroxymethylpyrimidine/phosphomethylpyrimidine kinase
MCRKAKELDNCIEKEYALFAMASDIIAIIAGLDPTGGAGISADIRAASAMGASCSVAATAIALQNHNEGFSVETIPPEVFRRNLECCFSISPSAFKVGMLGTVEIAQIVFEFLENTSAPIVIDPIIESSSGMRLIDDDGLESLRCSLFPLATLVTPNIHETEKLSGMTIDNSFDIISAGVKIAEKYQTSVLIKGGHSKSAPTDYLICPQGITEFSGKRVEGNFRGTGCSLSTLITVGLAKGNNLQTAVENAKTILENAMANSTPPSLTFSKLYA